MNSDNQVDITKNDDNSEACALEGVVANPIKAIFK
jgi:hypothetical protein